MTTATSTPTTPISSPLPGPADGPGEAEEPGYVQEAEQLAESAFSALDGFDDNDSGVEPPVETGSEVPAAQESGSPAVVAESVQTPTSPQEVAPSPEPAKPASPAEVAAAPVAPGVAPQGGEQPAATPATQEASGAAVGGTEFISQVRNALNESRGKFEEVLSTSVYGMSEDEASEVLVNPQQVLPKLAARVHMEVTQNILGTLAQILPGVVHGVNEATRQQADLTNQFFERWPQLKKDQDYGEVFNLARTFRSQYPQASAKEMIEHVGAMAVVKLGRLPAAAPAAGGAPAPVAPAAYRPAATVPSAVQPPPVQDFWSGVAENLDE